MHIVFGGAFNGKRQYVKEQLEDQEVDWNEGQLPEQKAAEALVVIGGLEHWVRRQLEQGFLEQQLMEQVKKAIDCGQAQQTWILTDLNRGIVPTERIEREMRDVLGRLYQCLFAEAGSITRIWYGIPQKIK
ncbi:bifunctional adenosylcobinamide kinase/adenosylcobinamide-phosphate guanylyltransferase [Planococcus sp. ISL-110]|uniref:bifunctional adenosylcobinamide kinase/adenosylcobinamide-phosphate guanylyltransferase n=1 Tax=Planococcus sp. ISL-110 TaxID=2819167 RepID=UPI001BEACDFC|nr:bifunctional adenosylcobinamide kinase/adenosylcobinamide-phosphate guanylyltransferase [Planococcus sp. ISL-110]MBT2570876.1 bifunctional adenosylcobinamide kinase/adenosylcobinamide-phosphate guanylyltransferase [Planococcus sp. ISL-110]